MDQLIKYLLSEKPWISLALLVAGYFAWVHIQGFLERSIVDDETTPERHANIRLTISVAKWVAFVILVALILQYNGIDVPGIVTGLGVAGIVVGFALQDALKDVIMGANIVWDNYFAVGDVVRLGDCEGVVVAFNFKCTRLQDIKTGNIVTISNRSISQVEVLSDWLDIDVPMGYDVDAQRGRETCGAVVERVCALDGVTSAEMIGTQEIAASNIVYRVRLHCDPSRRYAVRRAAQAAVQDVFAERGLEFPLERLSVTGGTTAR